MKQGWDALWQQAEIRQHWQDPSPWVVEWGERARAAGATRAYDLGCGVGRHLVALARLGFTVHGSDVSPAALVHSQENLARQGLRAALVQAEMTALPYAEACFDFVLAFNVVYHGLRSDVRRAIAEVERVLRPGGLFLVTFVSVNHAKLGESRRYVAEGWGREVEPGTFVLPGRIVDDEDLPHHFSDEDGVRDLLSAFAIRELGEHYATETALTGKPRRKAHWRAVAQKG